MRTARPSSVRSRWAAIGAAIAVTLGAGGLTVANATNSTPSSFVSITPERILDTRTGTGLDGPFTSPTPRVLQVTGAAVPTTATGVVLNVTAVQPTADGFISVRPDGTPGPPETSNLNFSAGDIIPNAVTVALPASGAIEITYDAFGAPGPTTHILADVTGYYLAGSTGEPGPAGPAGAPGPAGADAPRPANVVHVATSGGDFTTVQAAIDSITDASATNPYLVQIGPGTYPGKVTLDDHVHLRGAGRDVTVLTAPGGNSLDLAATVLGSGTTTSIADLTIVNTGGASGSVGLGLFSDADVRVDRVSVAVSGGTAENRAVHVFEAALDATSLEASAVGSGIPRDLAVTGSATVQNSRFPSAGVAVFGLDSSVLFVSTQGQIGTTAGASTCIASFDLDGDEYDADCT